MNNTKKFFENFNSDFLDLLERVKGKKIAVLGHMRPDGDCIGSQVAMAKILRKYSNCEVICINKDEVPFLYRAYVAGEKFLLADDFKDTSYEIISVDCASYERTSDNINNLFPKPFACIDHHITNKAYANINIIEPTSASTTELIAGLLIDCNLEFSADIASALYVGLVMDTRQFTTNSTTSRSLAIASLLVENGALASEISINLYQKEKFEKMKLLSRYLSTLELYCDDRVCGGVLSLKDFEETGATKEDCDGLVDFARSVNNVEIAFAIEEIKGGAKASLRSKDKEFAVDEIASNFGGGGHACAAGCNTNLSVEEFKKEILDLISKKF